MCWIILPWKEGISGGFIGKEGVLDNFNMEGGDIEWFYREVRCVG